MKWFFKPCRRYRQSICLLAGGALREDEQTEAQDHLGSCADCRNYFEQMQAITKPLTNWEKSLAQIEPSPSLQRRWTNAIQGQTRTKSTEPLPVRAPIERFWHELVLPLRWHLAGMSALWMIVAILNTEPSPRPAEIAQEKAPPRQLLMALRENRRQISELINPPSTESDALPEVFVPRRRSEIQLPTAIA